jgi:hypothetical protein
MQSRVENFDRRFTRCNRASHACYEDTATVCAIVLEALLLRFIYYLLHAISSSADTTLDVHVLELVARVVGTLNSLYSIE